MATSKPSHSQISSRVDQYERLSNTHSYLPNRGNNSRQSGQQVTGRQSQSWSHDGLSHHRPENQNDMLSGDRIEEARLQSMHIPIHAAAYEGNVERLEALINTGVNINFQAIRHKYKVTPLMIAASRGLLEVVRLLIQKGAEIDKLDNFKRPALMYAVFSGSLPVVYYLILHGSDVNHVDSSGYAPIHYTAISGHLQILKLLFHEGGANKTIPSQNNMGSPLMIARMRGHQDIVDFLMNDDASDRNPTTNRVLPSAPPIDNGISHGQVEENVPGITRPSAPPYSEVSQTSPTAPVLDDITASNLPTYDEVVSPGMPQGACGGQNIQTNSLFVPGDLPPPPSYQEVITNKVTYGITPWISVEGSNSSHNAQERFDRFMRRFGELMNFVASMSSEIEADVIPTDLNVAEILVKTHFDRKVKIENNFHRFKENHNEYITNGRCNLDDIKDKLNAVAEEENTMMKMFTVYMYEYDICVKYHRLWITIDTLLDKAEEFEDLFTSIVLSETCNALMGQRQQIAELDENLSSLKEEEKIVNEDFQHINRIHSLDYESRKIDFEVLSSQISSQLHQVADYFENLQNKFKDKQLLFETKMKSFTQNKTWVHGYFCSTAETGICSQIQMCIDSGVNINLQNQKGMTALHIAASKGHINFVRELLDRGADINSETTFGSSVLCEASKQKQINVVKLLIDRGAEIKAKYKMTGKSALHIACLNGYWDIVKLMVEKDKSVINDAPINGNPPLHYAAEEGNITMVNYLLDHGADENLLKNMNGEFPYKEDIVNCLCIDQSEDKDDANYDGARGTSLANDRNPHQSSKSAVGQTQPLSTPLSSSPLKSEQVIHKGILQRKHDMKSKTVKSFARKWVPMYGTLRGHEMYCRSYEIGDLGIYEKLKLPQHPVISLINAEVHHVDNYKRKKYVFRILLQNGGSFLFKTHSLDNMKLWLEKIQEAIYHEPTVDSIKLQPNKN